METATLVFGIFMGAIAVILCWMTIGMIQAWVTAKDEELEHKTHLLVIKTIGDVLPNYKAQIKAEITEELKSKSKEQND